MATQIGIVFQPGITGLRMRLRRMSDGSTPHTVSAGELESRPGCYVGGFLNMILPHERQNDYFLAELWDANLEAMLKSELGRITADEGELNLFAGVTDPHGVQLDRIEAHTSNLTTQDAEIVVQSNVLPGGLIQLKKGSDYRVRNNTAVRLTVADIGGSLATILKDPAQVTSIIFGAGEGRKANRITGTVDAANVTYNGNNTTTIHIEITKEQTADATPGTCYEWHLKAIAPVASGETDGDEAVRLEGTLELEAERARA